MTAVRYYTDEHVARSVIRGLRQRGIDVLTVPEAGMMAASDAEHLALAYSPGLVVFTQDADFLRLATSGAEHAGIVYAAQNTAIGDIVRGLVLIHQVLSTEEMAMTVEYI
jgi:predicted nuclease of predicted toxin-antitoxin system